MSVCCAAIANIINVDCHAASKNNFTLSEKQLK